MVSVIGAGRWGSAIYYSIKDKNSAVITSRRKRNIEGFVDLETALKSKYLIFAISAQHIKDFIKYLDLEDKKILIASKGIDNKELKFLNEIFEEKVDKNNLAVLGGPSFAKEVLQKKPTALVVASYNIKLAEKFAFMFDNFIKPYISNDVIGVEIAGAYKNVIAIASGICDGLELGLNARAALISRGLVEMQRFANNFNAKTDTFLGVAGSGDLFLTATSSISRNYRVGFQLSQNKKISDILKEINEVSEGVYTTLAIHKIATKYSIYTPIANEVYKIIYEEKPPIESLYDLLRR